MGLLDRPTGTPYRRVALEAACTNSQVFTSSLQEMQAVAILVASTSSPNLFLTVQDGGSEADLFIIWSSWCAPCVLVSRKPVLWVLNFRQQDM